jgi:hypothetical protein
MDRQSRELYRQYQATGDLEALERWQALNQRKGLCYCGEMPGWRPTDWRAAQALRERWRTEVDPTTPPYPDPPWPNGGRCVICQKPVCWKHGKRCPNIDNDDCETWYCLDCFLVCNFCPTHLCRKELHTLVQSEGEGRGFMDFPCPQCGTLTCGRSTSTYDTATGERINYYCLRKCTLCGEQFCRNCSGRCHHCGNDDRLWGTCQNCETYCCDLRLCYDCAIEHQSDEHPENYPGPYGA